MTATCAVHPETASVATCPRCGTFACAACWNPAEGFCVACVERGHRAPVPTEPDGWSALPRAVFDVLFRPTRFFSDFRAGGFVRPLLVGCLAWLAVGVAGQIAFGRSFDAALRGLPRSVAEMLGLVLSTALGCAAVLHVAARPHGRASFRTTLRACLYLHAHMLWFVVAWVALWIDQPARGVIGIALFVIVISLGVHGAYRFARGSQGLSTGRAVLAALAPLAALAGVAAAFVAYGRAIGRI